MAVAELRSCEETQCTYMTAPMARDRPLYPEMDGFRDHVPNGDKRRVGIQTMKY